MHMLRDGQKSSASLQQLLPLPRARDEGQRALPVLFTYGGSLTFEFTAHVSALVLNGPPQSLIPSHAETTRSE